VDGHALNLWAFLSLAIALWVAISLRWSRTRTTLAVLAVGGTFVGLALFAPAEVTRADVIGLLALTIASLTIYELDRTRRAVKKKHSSPTPRT